MADAKLDEPNKAESLGRYLKSARLGSNMTLREVEEATGKEVSNAYLSQLESGKIMKPSVHVLYALSTSLGVPYETLMERAGYIVPSGQRAEGRSMERQRLIRSTIFPSTKKRNCWTTSTSSVRSGNNDAKAGRLQFNARPTGHHPERSRARAAGSRRARCVSDTHRPHHVGGEC